MTCEHCGREFTTALGTSRHVYYQHKLSDEQREQHREIMRSKGAIGGKANVEINGKKHMGGIGLKGGEATKAKYGPDYYHKIGSLPKRPRKGGDTK